MYGTIARIIHAHGFGFIRCSDGWEIFFHRSSLSGLHLNRLREGQEIEFEVQRRRAVREPFLCAPVGGKLAAPKRAQIDRFGRANACHSERKLKAGC